MPYYVIGVTTVFSVPMATYIYLYHLRKIINCFSSLFQMWPDLDNNLYGHPISKDEILRQEDKEHPFHTHTLKECIKCAK